MSPPRGETAELRVQPEGRTTETDQHPRGPKTETPCRARRRAQRQAAAIRADAEALAADQAQARVDRREDWDGTGKDATLAYRQQNKLLRLDGTKRDLRQDVFKHVPDADPGSGAYVHTAAIRLDRVTVGRTAAKKKVKADG